MVRDSIASATKLRIKSRWLNPKHLQVRTKEPSSVAERQSKFQYSQHESQPTVAAAAESINGSYGDRYLVAVDNLEGQVAPPGRGIAPAGGRHLCFKSPVSDTPLISSGLDYHRKNRL